MTPLRFTVEGKPQPKQRARRGKGGRWYTPPETRQYQRAVAWAATVAASAHPRWSLHGSFELHVRMFMPDRRRRDADNVVKAISDSLNGVAFTDDAQVVRVVADKALDRERPRVEVEVVPVGTEAA